MIRCYECVDSLDNPMPSVSTNHEVHNLDLVIVGKESYRVLEVRHYDLAEGIGRTILRLAKC